jgi:penicillin-binding protein 1A
VSQRYSIRWARYAGIAALFLAVAAAGALSGAVFAYASDLPQISALDEYAPSTITRVLAADGQTVGEFATERRVVIGYDDIAPTLRQAILATEDAGFDRHFGLSIPRIISALMVDIMERRMAQGASTLTQQLARNLFLTLDKSFERKVKELILTIQIEKRYTKREIFTLYCNQIFLGHGAYGVEAASRIYFNKQARDLDLEESALIAGIIQRPARQSPYVDLNAAMRRRNYSLQRLADERYITQADADAAKKRPIQLAGQLSNDSMAPYFLEEVRKYLESRYGSKPLYESGLTVQTSLDLDLQRAANDAIDRGLRTLDRRRGYRRPARNVIAEKSSLEGFQHERWRRPFAPGQVVPAVVEAIDESVIRARAGSLRVAIGREGYQWTRRRASQLVKAGDLIEARLGQIDIESGTASGTLEQAPIVEGALVALDNQTGQVRAMVGGYSFERSKFNRAVQALRQVGSAFKPFVYTAAVDRGYTPASIIVDEPVTFPATSGQEPYSPQNYDLMFEGEITLRRAFEQSRNVPAVRIMDRLGPAQVVAYARRFGLEAPLPPYLSVALGAAEATLLEMTSAFSVFPNRGVRMRPYEVLKVSDRDGNLLEENRPEAHDAIRADTAYVVTNLLRGVVQHGTAVQAAALEWPLGGKTGTTDDYTDAWFIGFDPTITVGVWVGYDEKKALGPSETGAVAALPIWIDFMRQYIDARGDRSRIPEFQAPGNIVFLAVDRTTGTPATAEASDAITEAFISGTQPQPAFDRP